MNVEVGRYDPSSPPTRGAWIETPRKRIRHVRWLSPPTRGAWIETVTLLGNVGQPPVAPHAGGVD